MGYASEGDVGHEWEATGEVCHRGGRHRLGAREERQRRRLRLPNERRPLGRHLERARPPLSPAGHGQEPGRGDPQKGRASAQAQPEQRQTLGDVADWWLYKVYKAKVSIDTWHKAEERLPRIKQELGDLAPREVGYELVARCRRRGSAPTDAPDVLSNPTEQLLAFRRSRSPYGLEVHTPSAPELHVGVDLAVGGLVEVEVRLVTEVEVRAIATTPSDVDETVDGA